MKKRNTVILFMTLIFLTACGTAANVQEEETIPRHSEEMTAEQESGASGEATEQTTGQAEEKEGTLASFSTYDLDGAVVDESVFAGHKLTMINIWATFCGPCLREMPQLGELAAEYAEKDVQIIGIVADIQQNKDGTFAEEDVKKVRELVEQTGADYLHLLPSSDLIKAKLKDVSAVPETIFVDDKGNLIGESYLGSRSGEDWAVIIDQILWESK